MGAVGCVGSDIGVVVVGVCVCGLVHLLVEHPESEEGIIKWGHILIFTAILHRFIHLIVIVITVVFVVSMAIDVVIDMISIRTHCGVLIVIIAILPVILVVIAIITIIALVAVMTSSPTTT